MNFQQLKYVREAMRSDLNLTEAANALNTSQSGVSKQIRELEIELGIEIFVRRGKRIAGLTRAGEGAVKLIERVLQEAENLKRYAGEFAGEDHGRLVIATTHNQARYALPGVIATFAREFPGVQLELRQSTPREAGQSVVQGEADIAIATEALDKIHELATFSANAWRHVVIAPPDHPLAGQQAPNLADIAAFPLVTYSAEFSGRSQIDAAFAAEALELDIRLSAMDADVIKAYVAQGLGIGIVSEMAVDPERDELVILPGSRELFPESTTKIALLRGALLPRFAYRFIELTAPHLKAGVVQKAARERLQPKP